jgi:gamma-glutamylcyclotransferase (GGCT)/AIG2-like uncharacterized protein YtfP
MSSQGWYALGEMLLGVGAVSAGIWALYNYYRTRRFEAARWLQGVFRDFYLSSQFNDVRELLEYNYPERAGPLLERRITDRHVPITTEEMRLLQDLDTLLNYFEHVLYLELEGQIHQRDRQAVFEYWFDIMGSSDRASIRRYAAHFGFERVAQVLNAERDDYVAVYGSLRKGLHLSDHPEVQDELIDCGSCVIPGLLYDLGDYPGLRPGDGRVVGELYKLLDLSALRVLDEYERYDALHPDKSLYIRRAVRLVEPAIDAWTYIYNEKIDESRRILSGDWALHRGEKPDRPV